jgi:nucleoside-diphosphate-sugar epimerase
MKKIVVTGGSGRLGQLVIQELVSYGYQVLSLDRARPAVNLCPSWIADLRCSGDLYQALTGAYGVVHLGAYQAPGLAPDAEVFSNNVTASYNVLKAAGDLGVKKVVMASSTAAFGFIYALQRGLPEYLPLDEQHPSRPQDPYGLSKLVAEQIADSVALLHPPHHHQQFAFSRCDLRFLIRLGSRTLEGSRRPRQHVVGLHRRSRRGDRLPLGH